MAFPSPSPPARPNPETGAPPRVDVLVATYNSSETLAETLVAARQFVPIHCLIVVDRHSNDGTPEIARGFGAQVIEDELGLGYARNQALRVADTDPVLFLDSDVRITRPDFYATALREFVRPRTAAVVGMSVGHRFRYGLPLGLTLIGRNWALAAAIPDRAQGRETYYLQRAARRSHRTVRYVSEAMVHRGTYRRSPNWPEFQGASIRVASGWNPREVVYAGMVVVLMHMNSGSPRNVLYSPIFFAKILRGYVAPERWGRLDRNRLTLATPPGGPGRSP